MSASKVLFVTLKREGDKERNSGQNKERRKGKEDRMKRLKVEEKKNV